MAKGLVMRILAFSDWHIQPLGWLEEIVAEQQPDVILYAGDSVSRFFSPSAYILEKTSSGLREKKRSETGDNFVSKTGVPFYCVNGNNDTTLIHNGKSYVRDNSVIWESGYPIEYTSSTFVPVVFSFGQFKISSGKGRVTVFGAETERSDIKSPPDRYADIFLTHIPPKGRLDLSSGFGFGIKHIGSLKLLRAIKKHKPRLVICGHSHIWGGVSSRIGETLVINISSQNESRADPVNYALIDTANWSVRLLSRKDPEVEIRRMRISVKRYKERKASLKWNKPKVTGRITLNPDEQAFVDVETGRANGNMPGRLWLIGLWYRGELRQFLYPSESKEFVSYLRQNHINSLHLGHNMTTKLCAPC
jgi:Icc-related predicted phosphoesterase